MALSILEELCYCTTRIETKDKEGNLYSGTGFFYSFNIKDNKVVPLLCTNKHVHWCPLKSVNTPRKTL